jgi:U3 small nucleolar RNA-associated protein 10
MVSSLAAQLAKGASINAQFLASAGGRSNTTTESYLFSEKDASLQDLDSVLALAQNGVAQLTALIPELPSLSHNIFSEASRRLDRTIASPEEFAPLGKEISNVFRLISPYLLQPAAAKLVEWMVRRFRFA